MSKPSIQPLGRRILIRKPTPPEQVTKSGILLTEAPPPENIGEILAIGEEVKSVRVGDQVIYPTFGYTEITEDDTAYYLIDETDLLAKKL